MAGMATGNDDEYDAISAARDQAKQSASAAGRRGRVTTSGTQSNFPAANQVPNPANTAFARNAPINTPAQNGLTMLSQIPIGGIGASFGYRSQPMSLDNFTPSGGPQQQPTLQAYHWRAGSGGVQGGNDAAADVTWSNGTTGRMLGGVNDFQLGMNQPVPQPQYPQAPAQYPVTAGGGINYNVPGGSLADALNKTAPAGMDYNAGTGQYLPASTPGYMSTTKGPSQFASAPVTTNQFGQNMINSPNGGQMTTDKRQKPWLGGY